MKKISFFFVIFLFFIPQVFAQELGANPAIIIQQIASGTGPITRAEYDQFWKTLGITSRSDKERTINALRSGFILTQEYQKEVWTCVEKAWISRTASKCEKAQKKLDLMKATMNDEQKDALRKMDENSQRMIQTAAKREDFKITPEAAALQLNVDNIKSIRESLEKMLKRIEQVLRADY
jgi:hypothetical protein